MKSADHLWMDDYNSFDMFKDYDGRVLVHYCNADSLLGILENKCFWASNIDDFNDPNEGKLVYNHVLNNIETIIGHKNSSENEVPFMFSKCYVACFSKDENSKYMHKAFKSREADGKGRKIEIHLDTRRFKDSLFFNLKTKKEIKKFRIKCIEYIEGNNGSKVLNSIEEYLKDLWQKIDKDPLIDTAYKTELIKRKAFYLGTFIKQEDDKIPVSHEEQEVRVLINILNPVMLSDQGESYIDSHEHYGKEYVNFYFDLDAIEKKIVLEQSELDKVLSLIEDSKTIENDMKQTLKKKVLLSSVE